jgi:hypothetical protein
MHLPLPQKVAWDLGVLARGGETTVEETKGLVGCWRPNQPTRPTLEEKGESGGNAAEVPDKATVKVGKTPKPLHPLDGGWDWPRPYRIYLLVLHPHSLRADLVAQEGVLEELNSYMFITQLN